jgi:hypothetical protein
MPDVNDSNTHDTLAAENASKTVFKKKKKKKTGDGRIRGVALKTETARSSETSVSYHMTTLRQSPEDRDLFLKR